MDRKLKQIVRDRPLTEEEAAKYRKVRELVAEELPDLLARAKARLREVRVRPTEAGPPVAPAGD